ncbi:MAG: transglycosylase domain-containing protein [Cytophagaceae bacterium]|nr:transglycosylase domain-containing protein [Cytophagaceae bacterium]MDW8457389.1 transglycosylase domain-containing protein [Cytophagaceae bacterium]
MPSYRKIIVISWLTFAGIILGLNLFIFSVWNNLFGWFGSTPSSDILENPKSELASEVYSSDGVLLGKYYLNFNRSPVEYSDIPRVLIEALIATEDARFLSHSGVDIKGILAIVPSLITGKKRGSSTITQQLAKNLFSLREEEDYKGPISGIVIDKIKEWQVAVQLEKSYSKKEILLMYLNTVDFGNNAYGIKSAAKRYFNKEPKQLNTVEAALLVGLLKGPSVYNPRRYPERALMRRNTVLKQMLKYGYLSKAEYDDLAEKKITLYFSGDDDNSGLAPHFRAYIKPILKEWCRQHNKKLYEDGLKIYVPIDSRMQKYAEQAVAMHMSYLQKEFFNHWKGREPWTDEDFNPIPGFIDKMIKRTAHYHHLKELYGNNEAEIKKMLSIPYKMRVFTYKGERDTVMNSIDSLRYYLHFLHAGFMSMDPATGKIKAWVGDINYKYFKYDHVKQGKRQPGSAFKPILYALAINQNELTPDSKMMDVPHTVTSHGGKPWTPSNSTGVYTNEYMTLREALAKSVNSVSAKLIDMVRVDSLVLFAKKMGITSELDPVPTLCLGTSDVSVFELVNAYSVFVNKGIWNEPILIERIEDKYGNVLYQCSPQSKEVISEKTAYYMVELLKGSVEETGGTSSSLKTIYKIPGEIGGKTGTTQGNSDGWFIGIAPELVSGVWVGGEERSIRFRTMQWGQGAKMALPIWAYYMQKVYADPYLGYKKMQFDTWKDDALDESEEEKEEEPK